MTVRGRVLAVEGRGREREEICDQITKSAGLGVEKVR